MTWIVRCPDCGIVEHTDEDGCCLTCGRDTTMAPDEQIENRN